jgi:hypothetical protein
MTNPKDTENLPPFAAKTPPPFKGAVGSQPPPYKNPVHPEDEQLGRQELDVLRQNISEAGWISLCKHGANPADLLWYVEVTGASLRNSVNLSGGFLAETRALGCIYFRYTRTAGFQMANAAKSSCKAGIIMSPQLADLTLEFPDGSELSSVRILLRMGGIGASGGNWFDLWRTTCAQRLGVATEFICLADMSVLAPKQDDFGERINVRHMAALLAVGPSGVMTIPALGIDIENPAAWWTVERRFEILVDRNFQEVIVFNNVQGTRYLPAIGRLAELLPHDVKSEKLLADRLNRMGSFRCRLQAERDFSIRLLEQAGGEIIMHEDPPMRLTYGAVLGDSLILVSETGECVKLDVKGVGRSGILSSVNVIAKPVPCKEADGSWVVALLDEASRTPVQVIVNSESLRVNGNCISFQTAGEASVKKSDAASDLYAFSFSYSEAGGTCSQRLLASQQDAYFLWEEWEVGRTRQCASALGFPELYRRINADRRHEFLLAIYGDILFLNRALQDGVPMEELIKCLEGHDVTKLIENKALRDETVAKMILLLESINRMRQSGEVFASLYPYFWVQQEAEWLNSVFGSGVASSRIAQERKLVPALRRQIRGAQSELFRSLLQIETASRSIDALIGKEELRKHWSSRLIKFGPGLVQAGIGAALLLTPGAVVGGTMLASAGGPMLASAIGINGLGAFFGKIQQDREGSAQIMKAAEGVFPWWQILMTTLPVSLYESAQFLDEENMRAMKRDRAITDSLKPEQRPQMLKRLRQQLVAKIINNKRKAFREIIHGSGLRVIDLFDDIKQATTVSLKGSLDAFVAGMTLTPDKDEQMQGGTND